MLNHISIIMPVYNGEAHLDFSINSIIQQTYSDWELIIVDDGSTDNTPCILQKWASFDSRIHPVRQSHAGVSAARNLALSMMSGEYVTMIDADDALQPQALATMLNIMHSDNNLDMVAAGFCEMNPLTAKTEHRGSLLMGRKDSGSFSVNDGFLAEYMHCNIFCKLLRTQIIKQHRLQFDESRTIGEDHLFSLTFLRKCQKVYILQEELYLYMQWEQSTISRFDSGTLPSTVYIDSVVMYAELARKCDKHWGFALLTHFFRMRNWVKRVITTQKTHEWNNLRKQIDKHLPGLMCKAGLIASLRMFRRLTLS